MNKLVATTLESKFHVYDLRTQHPEKGFASLSEKVGVINLLIHTCRMFLVKFDSRGFSSSTFSAGGQLFFTGRQNVFN